MRRLLFAALLSLFATPCFAALSAVTIGTHHATAATTNVLTTTTNDCPVGSLVVILAAYATIADTLQSVTDSGGNTWQTPFDNITGTAIGIGWAYAVNTTVDIPIGGTITATFGGSVATSLAGVCISGAATSSPLDVTNQSANGLTTTSATTVNSGTLAQANEILLGGLVGASNEGTVTCGGSYTRQSTIGNTPSATICSQVVASTASVAFAPTWGNNSNYVTDLVSFKAPSSSSVYTPLTTTGIGP